MSTAHDDLDAWKRQRTVELAFELADSGRYENFGDIAYALQFERGMTTAQALIDDPDMRRLLNERCGDARDRLPPPEPEVVEAIAIAIANAIADASHDHAELPQVELPQAELPQATHFESAPSLLRRAMRFVWRSGAGSLNSAAS
ncbi:hypothetical protein [Caballeronia insecticola]|uniref:Uncharacterized protein n=1 Tax=Caballeronia insecticola TaxID=758793 RepID=R4WTP5_9BURK|nr:hypothetical protein [Caballeronia insecticola]BAN27998.1 putative uncharacterized protein [Caballeronia insecticola]